MWTRRWSVVGSQSTKEVRGSANQGSTREKEGMVRPWISTRGFRDESKGRQTTVGYEDGVGGWVWG